MLISMGVLAFYAIQQVAQAGWSPVLLEYELRLLLQLVHILYILMLCGLHFNHLFIWLDPEVVAHDKLIATKSGYLTFPFGLLEQIFFLIGWNLYRYYSAKNCLAQDESNDDSFYKKNFNISADFSFLLQSQLCLGTGLCL
jgi:hypothetical protein